MFVVISICMHIAFLYLYIPQKVVLYLLFIPQKVFLHVFPQKVFLYLFWKDLIGRPSARASLRHSPNKRCLMEHGNTRVSQHGGRVTFLNTNKYSEGEHMKYETMKHKTNMEVYKQTPESINAREDSSFWTIKLGVINRFMTIIISNNENWKPDKF